MQFTDKRPKCLIIGHFGDCDEHVPSETASMVEQICPGTPVFMCDAGHGFNCDVRTGYDAKSASLAQVRTFEFLIANLTAAPAGSTGG